MTVMASSTRLERKILQMEEKPTFTVGAGRMCCFLAPASCCFIAQVLAIYRRMKHMDTVASKKCLSKRQHNAGDMSRPSLL